MRLRSPRHRLPAPGPQPQSMKRTGQKLLQRQPFSIDNIPIWAGVHPEKVGSQFLAPPVSLAKAAAKRLDAAHTRQPARLGQRSSRAQAR